MTAKLRSRLWSWTGAALVATAATGVIAPNFLVAQPPAETAAKAEETAPTPARTFVGEMKGTPESARIAFVVVEDSFVAYVCSGDQSFNDTFSRWFRGPVKGGKLSAKTDCEAVLSATLTGDTVNGSITKEGKKHEFTATVVPADSSAGLFRTGETFDDKDFVVGWIVDEKDNVVGTGGVRGGKVQTLDKPKPGGNLQAQVTKKGDEKATVLPPPGKVTGTGTGADASRKGVKLDAANKAEILNDLMDTRKRNDGNAMQAIIVNQVKRFLDGKKPETKLEEKTFAVLKTASKDVLRDYTKDWDKIPKAERDTLLGSAAKALDESKGLDAAAARKLILNMPQMKGVKAQSATVPAGTVKKVSIPTVKCIDETNPEFLGSDEIFAIHTVIVGNSDPQVKQTSLLTGFDDGVTKNFADADATVFPLAGLTPTEGAEVFIVTTLYEDDGTGVTKFFNLLKPLIQVGVIAAAEALNGTDESGKDKKLTEVEKAIIKLAVDAAMTAALGKLEKVLVQPLGTDTIVVKPDGSVVAENGGAKNKMTFKKVKSGDVRYHYELSGFNVSK